MPVISTRHFSSAQTNSASSYLSSNTPASDTHHSTSIGSSNTGGYRRSTLGTTSSGALIGLSARTQRASPSATTSSSGTGTGTSSSSSGAATTLITSRPPYRANSFTSAASNSYGSYRSTSGIGSGGCDDSTTSATSRFGVSSYRSSVDRRSPNTASVQPSSASSSSSSLSRFVPSSSSSASSSSQKRHSRGASDSLYDSGGSAYAGLSASSLARSLATSGADLYEKYSPAHYIPKCEFARSRLLAEQSASSTSTSATNGGSGDSGNSTSTASILHGKYSSSLQKSSSSPSAAYNSSYSALSSSPLSSSSVTTPTIIKSIDVTNNRDDDATSTTATVILAKVKSSSSSSASLASHNGRQSPLIGLSRTNQAALQRIAAANCCTKSLHDVTNPVSSLANINPNSSLRIVSTAKILSAPTPTPPPPPPPPPSQITVGTRKLPSPIVSLLSSSSSSSSSSKISSTLSHRTVATSNSTKGAAAAAAAAASSGVNGVIGSVHSTPCPTPSIPALVSSNKIVAASPFRSAMIVNERHRETTTKGSSSSINVSALSSSGAFNTLSPIVCSSPAVQQQAQQSTTQFKQRNYSTFRDKNFLQCEYELARIQALQNTEVNNNTNHHSYHNQSQHNTNNNNNYNNINNNNYINNNNNNNTNYNINNNNNTNNNRGSSSKSINSFNNHGHRIATVKSIVDDDQEMNGKMLDILDDIKFIDSDDADKKPQSASLSQSIEKKHHQIRQQQHHQQKQQQQQQPLEKQQSVKLNSINKIKRQEMNGGGVTGEKDSNDEQSVTLLAPLSSPDDIVVDEITAGGGDVVECNGARNSSASCRALLPPTTASSSSRKWEREGRSPLSSISNDYNPDNQYASTSFTFSKSKENGSDKTGDTSDGLCGLRNIGNTCFMNSVIQCLSHTCDLTRFLRSQSSKDRTGSKDQAILTEYVKLIKEMWTPNTPSVTPKELKSAFSAKHRMYSGFGQQDAQEFLRFFLDSLHCALNTGTKGETLEIDDELSDNKKAELTWQWYSKIENSVIQDLFVGQLKSCLKCTVCGNSSVTFDPFWDLSVPLPSVNRCKLDACLDSYIREEVLDGDEMPTCAKCKTRRKCTKTLTIQRFPKYLAIHLKRFSETRWSKLTNIVEFPTGESELNMTPYAANSTGSELYSLYGISNHMGSTSGGHYVANCRHPVTRRWHEFNDNMVGNISENSLVTSSAYLLFYERATAKLNKLNTNTNTAHRRTNSSKTSQQVVTYCSSYNNLNGRLDLMATNGNGNGNGNEKSYTLAVAPPTRFEMGVLALIGVVFNTVCVLMLYSWMSANKM